MTDNKRGRLAAFFAPVARLLHRSPKPPSLKKQFQDNWGVLEHIVPNELGLPTRRSEGELDMGNGPVSVVALRVLQPLDNEGRPVLMGQGNRMNHEIANDHLLMVARATDGAQKLVCYEMSPRFKGGRKPFDVVANQYQAVAAVKRWHHKTFGAAISLPEKDNEHLPTVMM